MLKRIAKSLPPIRRLVLSRDALLAERDALLAERDALLAEREELIDFGDDMRRFLAHRYVHGSGLEIGAAHKPLSVPPEARVTYVDAAPLEELRRRWPELNDLDAVEVDVVDDGERLEKFLPYTQDFVIACHFLEHCLDPIGALINMHRVLRAGGVLFLAVPDKRHTFDVDRPVTPYEHLLEEHADSTRKFLEPHSVEYVRLAERRTEAVEERVRELIDSEYRIHYHVWSQTGLIEMLMRTIGDFGLQFEFAAIVQHADEVIVVLRRLEQSPFRA